MPLVVAWIFEIRLLFLLRKNDQNFQHSGIRRTLTSHLGRGSFVLIECYGFLVVTTAAVSQRQHAFFFFLKKIVCLAIESMIRRPMDERIEIQSRRYIGSKAKLIPWIFDTIRNETAGVKSFCDIFAGTGVVANEAIKQYEKVVDNDLLYSNNVIY